jgi:hypothetical protein
MPGGGPNLTARISNCFLKLFVYTKMRFEWDPNKWFMKHFKEFPFEGARHPTEKELKIYRKAIEEKLGVKRPFRGRPPKPSAEKYRAVSIRLHPLILKWAKKEAKKRGMKYQSVINQTLLKFAA